MKLFRISLTSQIVIAVVLGLVFGRILPTSALMALSEIGKLVIHWIKLVAGPFLFFTILASLLEVQLDWKEGLRLLRITGTNALFALMIGAVLTLTLLNIPPILTDSGVTTAVQARPPMSFDAWLTTWKPQSLLEPLFKNDVLLLAVLALLMGLAARKALSRPEDFERLRGLISFSESARRVLMTILEWIIAITPLAVFAITAGVSGTQGLGALGSMARFAGVVLLAFTTHCVLVYGYWIVRSARMDPRVFLREARTPAFHAFGVNSSLAALPLTFQALKNLQVSRKSAALGAGVGTNLNNDGILLYEVMAAFFVASQLQIPLDALGMLTVAATCVIATLGVTGVPEAGFISLTVVLATLGYPAELLPLLLTVDWLLARARSAVNVLSDMTVSIGLDALAKRDS